jgi:DNA processing protein
VRAKTDLERFYQEKILAQDTQVFTWESENYPARLKPIDQPPPVLYMCGTIIQDDNWALAVVVGWILLSPRKPPIRGANH